MSHPDRVPPFTIQLLHASNDPAPITVTPLSLHDALPILVGLPKTIDNDIIPIAQSLGAHTAADQASRFAQNIIGEHRSNPDRKSTRLNSSHVAISYAVICLKKKKSTILHVSLLSLYNSLS